MAVEKEIECQFAEAVTQRCSAKKYVLRSFLKSPGKHRCQSLFLNTVAGQACNFIKKEPGAGVFQLILRNF